MKWISVKAELKNEKTKKLPFPDEASHGFTQIEWDTVLSKNWDKYHNGKPYPLEYEWKYVKTKDFEGWVLRPCKKKEH